MRKLYLKKRMLTIVAFVYAGILVASVTYAAVLGNLTFTGTTTTNANVKAGFFSIRTSATTEWGSNITVVPNPLPADFDPSNALAFAGAESLTVTVDLKAPGDFVWLAFTLANDGTLPVEFMEPEIEMTGVRALDADGNDLYVNGVPIYEYPVMVEGFAADLGSILGTPVVTRDFEDIDGYTLIRNYPTGTTTGLRSVFGLMFTWDEDVIVNTSNLEFTITLPYTVGDINPVPLPTLAPSPSPDPNV